MVPVAFCPLRLLLFTISSGVMQWHRRSVCGRARASLFPPTDRTSWQRVTAVPVAPPRCPPPTRADTQHGATLSAFPFQKIKRRIGRALRCWSFIWSTSSGFHLPVPWLPLPILIENIPWNFLPLSWPPHDVMHMRVLARSHDLPPPLSVRSCPSCVRGAPLRLKPVH